MKKSVIFWNPHHFYVRHICGVRTYGAFFHNLYAVIPICTQCHKNYIMGEIWQDKISRGNYGSNRAIIDAYDELYCRDKIT